MVTIHPKSPTKTNHITLRFTGEVFLSIKDKETITLFQKTETIAVANDGAKTHVLDAKQHNYDFEFVVPDDLPSAMEVRFMFFFFNLYLTKRICFNEEEKNIYKGSLYT